MKSKIILLFFLNAVGLAQVGIGTTAPNGALEVNANLPSPSTNLAGLLPPNVSLSGLNTNNTTTAGVSVVNPNGGGLPANGTIVYNTNTSALGVNQVTPGYYFWQGSGWVRLQSEANQQWNINGNASTNPTNDFIGTTDNQELRFRTNNNERLSITTNGRIRSFNRGNAAQPTYSWTDDTDIGLWSSGANTLNFSTNAIERVRINNNGVIVNSTTSFTGDRLSSYGNANEYAVNGYSSGAGVGLYGEVSGANGIGVFGINTNTAGTAVLGIGQNAAGSFLTAGSGAAFTGASTGSVSFATNTTNGWGVLGAGNNLGTTSLTQGGGGAFSGLQWGVYANATISGSGGTDRAAFVGNFNEVSTNRTVYLGARVGGVNYKVLGTGATSVSTTMTTRDGERILFAPEAPENWFFDIGEVNLVNGKALIALDPLFVDCISDSKPFKVFIQGAEDTLGSIRVSRNQSSKTFTLEDLGGPSNGVVQYSVYAIWKDKENLRFPKYEAQLETIENKKTIVSKKEKNLSEN